MARRERLKKCQKKNRGRQKEKEREKESIPGAKVEVLKADASSAEVITTPESVHRTRRAEKQKEKTTDIPHRDNGRIGTPGSALSNGRTCAPATQRDGARAKERASTE